MRFPRRMLRDGEDLVLDVRPHWTAFAASATVLAAALSVLIASSVAGAPELLQVAVAGGTLVALGRFVVGYLRWASARVVLTDRRLVHRHGVLLTEEVEVALGRVHAVELRRTLGGRLLGYGDLVVRSGGEQGEPLEIERLARPRWVQAEICRQLGERNRR